MKKSVYEIIGIVMAIIDLFYLGILAQASKMLGYIALGASGEADLNTAFAYTPTVSMIIFFVVLIISGILMYIGYKDKKSQ